MAYECSHRKCLDSFDKGYCLKTGYGRDWVPHNKDINSSEPASGYCSSSCSWWKQSTNDLHSAIWTSILIVVLQFLDSKGKENTAFFWLPYVQILSKLPCCVHTIIVGNSSILLRQVKYMNMLFCWTDSFNKVLALHTLNLWRHERIEEINSNTFADFSQNSPFKYSHFT